MATLVFKWNVFLELVVTEALIFNVILYNELNLN